jgi:hypothetical protein
MTNRLQQPVRRADVARDLYMKQGNKNVVIWSGSDEIQ